ncbi:MAG: hypothetical protein WC711_04160, partial [Candidatus Staskawiczbacteria bacterium]
MNKKEEDYFNKGYERGRLEEQREEIMRIANTNINVATDLRDRLREDVLQPLLKNFGHETG